MPNDRKRNSSPTPAVRRSTVAWHLVLSALLWVTYVLYWRVVLVRGVEREAGLSLLLLGLFIVVQIVFTQAWILHNRRLASPRRNRRRNRLAGRPAPEADFLGRRLRSWPEESDLTRAPWVVIRVEGEEKRFETGLFSGSETLRETG